MCVVGVGLAAMAVSSDRGRAVGGGPEPLVRHTHLGRGVCRATIRGKASCHKDMHQTFEYVPRSGVSARAAVVGRHHRWMLSAEVSWRCEPGINRAYVWLSDGSIAGYRDLDAWLDYPSQPSQLGLINDVLAEWTASTGVPCAAAPQEPPPPALGDSGVAGWFKRRRARRRHEQAVSAYASWRLDHPIWKIPIDPPHGGWTDLVRNDPGQALWEHASQLPAPPWYAVGAKREARAWRVGAMGEETVAEELSSISRTGNWRYVHSVPVGSRGSDIDHVLVGPAGVFTVNTKSHRDSNVWVGPNTIMVSGHRQPYLRNSRHEANRASRLLSAATGFEVSVHPVIAVVDPRNITYRNPPSDVTVVTRRGLKRWATSLRPALSDEHIESIFSVARRSTTWV
jgi:Nuclease-related domain